MSLAEEITKLHGLLQLNILSAEEFQAAKLAVIQRFAAPTTAARPSPSPSPSPAEGATQSPDSAAPPPPPEEQQPQQQLNKEGAKGEGGQLHTPTAHPPPTSIATGECAAASAAAEATAPCEEGAAPSDGDNGGVMPLLQPVLAEELRAVESIFPLLHLSGLVRLTVRPGLPTARLETALAHLRRVLGNIADHPEVAKYHQLRRTNPTLATELFSVDGADALLRSVGFADDGDGEWVRWPAAESAALLPAVEQGLNAVCYLQERVEGVARHRIRLEALLPPTRPGGRRNVAVDIRVERAMDARAAGRLQEHLSALFGRDEAGDGLYSAAGNARLLAAVAECAADASSRAGGAGQQLFLPLESPALYAAAVEQPGGLELLLVGCGAALEQRVVAGAAVVGCAFTTTAPQQLREGSAVAAAVAAAVAERRAASDREARRVAEAAVRREVRQGQRRHAHALEVQAARAVDGSRPAKQRRRFPAPSTATASSESSSASADDDDEEEEGVEGARGGSGRRVPIAEALALLMGKRQ